MPGWEPTALCPGGHVTASSKAAGCKDTLRRGLGTGAHALQSSRTQPEGQGCSGLPIPHPWHLASPPGLSCSSSHRAACCQPGGNGPVWSCLVLHGGACLGRPPQGPLGTIFPTTSLLLLCLPCDFASSHPAHFPPLSLEGASPPGLQVSRGGAPPSPEGFFPSLLGCGYYRPTWADLALLWAFLSCSGNPCGRRCLKSLQE